MAFPNATVNRDTVPLPPPDWADIFFGHGAPIPFPAACGCAIWRLPDDPEMFAVAHEPRTCAEHRDDADWTIRPPFADGPIEPLVMPRPMLAAMLWPGRFATAYNRVWAARAARDNAPRGVEVRA